MSARLRNIGEKEIRIASVHLCVRKYLFGRRHIELQVTDLRRLGPIASGIGQDLVCRIPENIPTRRGRARVQLKDEIGSLYQSNAFPFYVDRLGNSSAIHQ